MEYLNTVLMGIIEGITEFLPVSSTGHLILLGDLLHFEGPPGHVFEVVIQFGAILAIVALYWRKFWDVLVHLGKSGPQRFVRNLFLAFLPAMVIGAFAHDYIKNVLFNPTVVAIALIVGGVAIILIERLRPEPTVHSTEEMNWCTAVKIGFMQCIAMVPGVSRSGATIMGALLMGVERKNSRGIFFLSCGSHHVRGECLRPLQGA